METKVDIYCEFGFLEKFYITRPHNRNNSRELKYWADYNEFLCSRDNIIIMDMNEKLFYEQSEKVENPILREVFPQMLADGIIVCCPTEKKYMEACIDDHEGNRYFDNDKFQTLFFLDAPSDKCRKLENDYGLMFISKDNFMDRADFLFSSDIEFIDENRRDWSFVKKYKQPCNSIVLVDNYLLRNGEKWKDNTVLEENIKSLFDALLPSCLNLKTFSVQICTTVLNDGRDEAKKTLVENTIRNLRPYTIDVSISTTHLTTGNNHDRYLITNYCIFTSGYGFVLTKSERKKGTSLAVWPLTYISYRDKESRNSVYRVMQHLRHKMNI